MKAVFHEKEFDPTAALAWLLAAWVAGVFSVIVGATILVSHLGTSAEAPLKAPDLEQLRERLGANPTDEQLKQRIRKLDLRVRQSYFLRLARVRTGSYLLLGGIALFIVSATRVSAGRRALPMPKPKQDDPSRASREQSRARWSVAAAGTLVGIVFSALAFGLPSALPRDALELDKLLASNTKSAPANDFASLAELEGNWPRFRGFDGSGVSPWTNLPAAWDVKSGNGILWKAPAPAKGFNSPIVWGNRLFLSGGDAAKREVFCLDASSGQVLWRQQITVPSADSAQVKEIPETTGYAAATMATDGRRVYVVFANGDGAALTLDGRLLWAKCFGPLDNAYGHATSLATWHDRLLLQLDQGDGEGGKSKLCALDGQTGAVVWQQPRKVGSSWASPIVIEAAGKSQVITLAVPSVIAYDASSGNELWRVERMDGEVTPSPICAGGLVVAASPSIALLGIRPDGHGDVTTNSVVWENEDNVPDVTSPTGNTNLIFTITSSGVLTCLDAKTGKTLWEHDYQFDCHASPSLAGDRLYIFGQKGAAVVVEAARQFKELFRTDMGDSFHASPAFANGRIFLRGETNLWCLGSKESR